MPAPAKEVTRVYLHSPSEAPDARVVIHIMPALECIGERSLFFARPGDVVCLGRPVDGAYFDFLSGLGIGPRWEDILVIPGVVPGTGVSERLLVEELAWERLVERLAASRRLRLCPYFSTPAVAELARALGDRLGASTDIAGGPPRVVGLLHDKRFARRLARRLGIPLAPGETVRVTRLRESVLRWARTTGRVIVRGASGAGGSATFTCGTTDLDATIDRVARRTDNVSYLVQPLYPVASSPNVEIAMGSRPGMTRLTATDQMLSHELVYEGSLFPSRALRRTDMIAAARRIAGWMARCGFTGRAGLDFVEPDPGADAPPFFLAEINPRINGASYPIVLMDRLSEEARRRELPLPRAFRTHTVATEARDFGEIKRRLGDLLYDPGRGRGVVPYTVGGLAFGTIGMAAFANGVEAAMEIYEEAALRAGTFSSHGEERQGAVLRR